MKYAPRDFASECPPPRIIGTETEHYLEPGGMQTKHIERSLDSLGIAHTASHSSTGKGTCCSNGARIYPEFGIEYASPECLGPLEAATADSDGMSIVDGITRNYRRTTLVKHYPVLRCSGTFSVNSGSTDSRGNHQNFLIPHPENNQRLDRLKAWLGSFLATRIIWDGAGMVVPDAYLLSQKADSIGEPVVCGYGSNRTQHGAKPLAGFLSVSQGAGADKVTPPWALIEVRCADAHMSKAQIYSSLAITSLALRLDEQGIINETSIGEFTIKNPVQALRDLNGRHGRGKLQLESGGVTTALGLQEHYAEAILKMAEKIELPKDEQAAAEKYLRLCDNLGRYASECDLDLLVPDIEWATKLICMRKKYGEKAPAGDLINALAFDYQWHKIDERSVGLKVYEKLGQPRPSLAGALKAAPPTTRAAARGQAIASGQCTQAGWNKIIVKGREIRLDDYWDPELPEQAKQKALVA